MFVWVCHRVTGVLLILLLGLKFFTGFFLMTKETKPDWAIVLHTNPLSDVLLILCVAFHAIYGLRTIFLDMGWRRENLLFWLSTLLASMVTLVLIVLYFSKGQG
jgi:succinate dehydrogenase/fumarate reductase cytochrome b subunit